MLLSSVTARRATADRVRASASACVIFGFFLLVHPALAQIPDTLPPPGALKRLTLEQLMDVEVTSVSRRPEKLSTTASAIQIITGDDIRRSGASSIPEALRLAPNLQVAQVSSSQWAVSARGFNNTLANKLLVLIDGRTIYTPLYAGVFWDVQNLPLDAVDRIEVVSGPGGTLWGANAVNGVINIITKPAKDTQGLLVEGGAGTELHGFGAVRYGGRSASGLAYRLYGHGFGRGSTVRADGTDPRDSWGMGQGGVRLDWNGGKADAFSVQSDYYDGRPDTDGRGRTVARGGNALGRWTRTLSEESDLQLQVYYDRSWRDFGIGLTEDLTTYDLDGQHRFQLGRRQEVVWGLTARLMVDDTESDTSLAFLPANRTLQLYGGFVQDEIALSGDRLRLSLGSKFEHNSSTGFEVQPSVRLAWTPASRHTVWGAVSRAVRTPSRIDRDFFLFVAPSVPILAGSDIQSEKLIAYELGWRAQARPRLSLSVSTFYNDYDDLRTVEPGPPPAGIPFTLGNGLRGHAYGVELATVYQVSDRVRLRGGYTFLKKKLSLKPGSADPNGGRGEGNDPEHQFLIQSSADLPGQLELDAVFRFVDALPDPRVPSYADLDLRLGWKAAEHLELAVVGQNLLHGKHIEFNSSPSAREVQRGVYGRITWR
jgi:iron complex outermembrane receptor protein